MDCSSWFYPETEIRRVHARVVHSDGAAESLQDSILDQAKWHRSTCILEEDNYQFMSILHTLSKLTFALYRYASTLVLS